MNETTIFREALGDSSVIRVLDFLIEGRGLDYSLTDISENAHVSWTTLHRIWDQLVRLEFVIHTRKIGRAKLYKLNEDNTAVKQLIRLYDTLLVQQNERFLSEEVQISTS